MAKLGENKEQVSEQSFEKPNTIVIKNKEYKIKPLNARDGLRLWEYLLGKLLPSVGTGLDRMSHDELLDGSPTTFAQAMIHLVSNLEKDYDTLNNITDTILEGCLVDGKPLNTDEEFSCNYGAWRQLLIFALKVNFSSFFEEGWESALTDITAMVVPMMSKENQE